MMSLLGLLLLLSAALLNSQVVYIKGKCLFFTTHTEIVPNRNGSTSILNFTINNTCEDNSSLLQSVKVAFGAEGSVATPMCEITSTNGVLQVASGCSFDNQSQTLSVTNESRNKENMTWIFWGKLQNGEAFKEAVHAGFKCVSFADNATLVLHQDGKNATAAFSTVNTCTTPNTAIEVINVLRNTDRFPLDNICDMRVFNNSWLGSCSYSESSNTFSATSKINNHNETWILYGGLQNGGNFTRKVQLRADSGGASVGNQVILTVSVSASVVVTIILITLIAVCCVKSRHVQNNEHRSRMGTYAVTDMGYSSHLTRGGIFARLYRGSNVSIMIHNEIYAATESQFDEAPNSTFGSESP